MGLLGGAAVLLYSVDQNTRLQGGKQQLARRMRPPRAFEPQLPQLRTLAESMVVRVQLVLESVYHLSTSGLGHGMLWFVATLHVATPHNVNGGVEVHQISSANPNLNPSPNPSPSPSPTPNQVHEISRTQEIEWPYDERHHHRVWDEVITVEPTSLTDVVVLSLWHRRRTGGFGERMPLLVGETRVPVLALALAPTPALALAMHGPKPKPKPKPNPNQVLEVHRSANMRREKPGVGGGGGGRADGHVGAGISRASSASSSPQLLRVGLKSDLESDLDVETFEADEADEASRLMKRLASRESKRSSQGESGKDGAVPAAAADAATDAMTDARLISQRYPMRHPMRPGAAGGGRHDTFTGLRQQRHSVTSGNLGARARSSGTLRDSRRSLAQPHRAAGRARSTRPLNSPATDWSGLGLEEAGALLLRRTPAAAQQNDYVPPSLAEQLAAARWVQCAFRRWHSRHHDPTAERAVLHISISSARRSNRTERLPPRPRPRPQPSHRPSPRPSLSPSPRPRPRPSPSPGPEQASHLRNKGVLGLSDPYCQFTLSGRYTNVVRRTAACRSNLQPRWDEDFHLLIRLENELDLLVEVHDAVRHVACGMWHVHVACGMWHVHVACGMWHVACGMWHVHVHVHC